MKSLVDKLFRLLSRGSLVGDTLWSDTLHLTWWAGEWLVADDLRIRSGIWMQLDALASLKSSTSSLPSLAVVCVTSSSEVSGKTSSDDTGHDYRGTECGIGAGAVALLGIGWRWWRVRILSLLTDWGARDGVISRSGPTARASSEVILGLFDLESEIVDASTLDLLQEAKLLSDIGDWLVQLVLTLFFILDVELWNFLRAANEVPWDKLHYQLIRNAANGCTNWNGEETKGNRITPATSIKSLDGESLATKEHDDDLKADHDAVDSDEELVLKKTLENVELVVQTTVTG